MRRRKFHLPKVRKCPTTGKTIFKSREQARIAMMRVISHTTTDMFDLHTYPCEYRIEGKEHFHFGHKSYYEKSQQTKILDNVSVGLD